MNPEQIWNAMNRIGDESEKAYKDRILARFTLAQIIVACDFANIPLADRGPKAIYDRHCKSMPATIRKSIR